MTKRANICVFAFIVIVLCCPFLRANEKNALEDDRLADLIDAIKPSIVAVGTYYFNDVPKTRYMGTGFVIMGGKRLVTNFHVVSPVMEKNNLSYLRIFHKNFPVKGIGAKIIATDEFHDLAILEQEGDPLPALKLSDSLTVREGYRVAFTGYPIGLVLGLNPTTHTGIISSIAPLIKPSPSARIINGELIRHLNEPYDIFQIDATAYPGNSGSPVYRTDSGMVIGVINKVFVKGKKEHALTEPTGITYAIPVNFIKVLEKSIKSAQ
ncbi:MAG: serine protease [Proteobacteria bacterium]|nr:serine protease [Pseudomonadota bacterium]MBU1584474.1 serine protease [Pseudomonadota bacterium]MBU2627910.1 serine protease [Pseudomonadota bacterium]